MNRSFCVLASLFCLLSLAAAQNDRGSITGKISDPSGAVVVGAAIKVISVGTGSTYEATTDADGHFATPSILQVGTYRVEAARLGFKTAVSPNLDLRIGDVREVNLTMQLGETAEKVEVTAETPIVQTETSSNGDVIEGRQVTELPLRDRNFTSLALLTPGVDRAFSATVTDSFAFNQGDPNAGGNGITDSRGDTPASRFSRSGRSAITANGLRTGNNNFTLDGIDDNEPIYGEIGVFPNPDAIQEFQVQTSLAKGRVRPRRSASQHHDQIGQQWFSRSGFVLRAERRVERDCAPYHKKSSELDRHRLRCCLRRAEAPKNRDSRERVRWHDRWPNYQESHLLFRGLPGPAQQHP
jgi:hypothetical protein